MLVPRISISPDDDTAPKASAMERVGSATARLASAGYGANRTALRVRKLLFSESMFENSSTRPRRRTMDFLVSAAVHGFLLGAVILIPLFFTQAMDIHEFTATLLVAPPHAPAPPPPPAPVAVARAVAVRKAMLPANTLVVPKAIPKHVSEASAEADAMPEFVPGGGVPGGIPGGIPGGVIGGVLGGTPSDIMLPPPASLAPKGPIRVGGDVKPPRIISRVEPVYPILARQARVSGDVMIEAVIDTHGNVVEMRAVSGPPLLIPAAIEALRQWKYEPTILAGQPYPVRLSVTITFRLH